MPLQIHRHSTTPAARAGFSLIELLTVVSIVGLLVLIATPRIGRALSRRDVAAARAGFGSLFLQARVAAVTARRPAVLIVDEGMAYVSLTGALGSRRVGPALQLEANGIGVAASGLSLTVQPTGLVVGGTPFTVMFSKSGITDTVTISGYGVVE